MFTTKFNDSSILITTVSCDYLNLSLTNGYVGIVTIPSQVISGVARPVIMWKHKIEARGLGAP